MALQVTTAGTGVVRDAHYVTPTGASAPVRTLLLEPQRTNLCIRSEEFDTWTSFGGSSVTANAAVAPDGSTTADLIVATTTAGQRRREVSFTGDGTKCVALFAKAGTSTQSRVALRDITAALDRRVVLVNWSAGVPTLADGGGAGTLYPVQSLGNGWYRLMFAVDAVVAANVNNIVVSPDIAVGTNDCLFWGAQAENAVVPSSYIPTVATTVTRNADSLYWDIPALVPRELTVYVRGVEQERPSVAPAVTQQVVHVGVQNAATFPVLGLIRSSAAAGYRIRHDPNGSAAATTNSIGATAAYNDVVELRGVLAATGATTLGVSISNAAETTVGPSTAAALAANWAAARFWLAGSTLPGAFAFTHVAIALGTKTRAEMRSIAGV